jgi:hypothetical protein
MAKTATKHLVTNYRVNARGSKFYKAYLWDLERVQAYSSAASNAKTVKSAVSKMNKELDDRYSCCYTQFSYYTYIGKIKVPADAELPESSCAKYSAEELQAWVEENWGKEIAKMVEENL